MFALFLSDAMDPFYQNITSFPTVFFTFPLMVCLLYWLVAVLGFVDLDVLDLDAPSADSPTGEMEVGSDSGSGAGALAGWLLKLGLTGVPLTIVLSFVFLLGWLVCYFLVHFGLRLIPQGGLQLAAGVPVFILSLYTAMLMTAQMIKPLRPLFAHTHDGFRDSAHEETAQQVLGQTAVVRSSRIDQDFGEVFLADGGAGLIFKARSIDGDTFRKGDRVVLLEYLASENAYRVISEQAFLS